MWISIIDAIFNFLKQMGNVIEWLNTPLNESFDIKPSLFTLILRQFNIENPLTWLIYRSPLELLTGSLIATLSFVLIFRIIAAVVGWIIG